MELYKIGSRGEVVKQIQKALHLIPDGIFGKLTEEAVISFQNQNGLKPDGIVGPATLAKLIPVRFKRSSRVITDIVIHCTATKPGLDYTANDIRKMHKAQGWSDIGYHYIVRLNGAVEPGRDVDMIGAHVSGHNAHSIGIAYVGGINSRGKAEDNRTEAQKASLLALLVELRKLYPRAKISGHRDFSRDLNHDGVISPDEWIKECPCFNAADEYRRI
jgi:hypothetical protein